MGELFSGLHEGRISRTTFNVIWIGTILATFVVGMVLLQISPHSPRSLLMNGVLYLYFFLAVLAIWIVFVSVLKRARDIGWSAMWTGIIYVILSGSGALVFVALLVLALVPTDYARGGENPS